MGALMLTATHAKALPGLSANTGRSQSAVLRNCSSFERAARELALEIIEAGAALPPHAVLGIPDRAERIAANAAETLDSLTKRMNQRFLSAWRSGACVTLARFALGTSEPAWGWRGRRTLLETLARRAADQLVDRYEIAVMVPASPQSEIGACSFDLLDRLMRVTDSRGMLRLQFSH